MTINEFTRYFLETLSENTLVPLIQANHVLYTGQNIKFVRDKDYDIQLSNNSSTHKSSLSVIIIN